MDEHKTKDSSELKKGTTGRFYSCCTFYLTARVHAARATCLISSVSTATTAAATILFSDVWKERFPTNIFLAILLYLIYVSGTSRSFAEGRSEKNQTLRTEAGGSKPNSQHALLKSNNMQGK
jgi:hypothetical protein